LEIASDEQKKEIVVKENIFPQISLKLMEVEQVDKMKKMDEKNFQERIEIEKKIKNQEFLQLMDIMRVSQREKEKESVINALCSKKIGEKIRDIKKEELSWKSIY